MPTTTIRDVAKEAGVSIATVSYVLNGSKHVADDTRRRVLETVERLGYRANIMARNLQASETRLLGYTWRPSPAGTFNPILDRFLQAIAEAAAQHGYRILTFPTNSIEEELDTYRELTRIGQVDGFVLSNTNLHDQRVRSLLDANFPFVAFGRSNPEWDFPWVDVDGAALPSWPGRNHRSPADIAPRATRQQWRAPASPVIPRGSCAAAISTRKPTRQRAGCWRFRPRLDPLPSLP